MSALLAMSLPGFRLQKGIRSNRLEKVSLHLMCLVLEASGRGKIDTIDFESPVILKIFNAAGNYFVESSLIVYQ